MAGKIKICAVCIPAYDCAEFLDDILESIQSQKKLTGWKYDIRIGVDACRKTAKRLDELGIDYFWSEENVGHLSMRNALMRIKPADVYVYFDADDIMLKTYIKRSIEETEKNDFVMFQKINTDATLTRRGKPVIENGGAMAFSHAVLDVVGGFQPVKCAGDTDLMRRAEMAGFKIAKIQEPQYLRRAHNKALTRAEGTNFKSDYRKNIWKWMCDEREKGIIKIDPELPELRKIKHKRKIEKSEEEIDPVYILIRTSGRPKFFEKMMESIRKQTYKNIITIVHTDNEKDKDYIDGDIVIESEPYPREIGTATYNLYCNKLLEAIPDKRGWYMFLDDDDIFSRIDAVEKFVKNSDRYKINICRVRRWNGTVWPRAWGKCKSFQTECMMLHTDHKLKWKWNANIAGDHYYSRQATKELHINWIDGLIACEAQKGKGLGQRIDLNDWSDKKKRISHVGARNLGPPVKVQYIRKTHGRKNERGLKGEVKIIPEKYAKRLEKVGRVVILNSKK